MTPADIERMAREAGGSMLHGGDFALWGMEDIARFAALVQAAERERCAKVCDETGEVAAGLSGDGDAAWYAAAQACAKLIRGG